MRYKILLFLLLSSFVIFFTYNFNYKKHVNIVSINSLANNQEINYYVAEKLGESKVNYNYNVDFSSSSLEIENFMAIIDNNENNIKEILHKADVIILSIGNNDIKNEELNIVVNEFNMLLKKIRSINSKKIIYISPPQIVNSIHMKELCKKYNIMYINGLSYKNNEKNMYQSIINKINNIYNKKYN